MIKEKWYTITEYVDTETGELITKSETVINYIIVKKTIKYENNKNWLIKKITIECERSKQHRLEL